jgi:hypothetical protein
MAAKRSRDARKAKENEVRMAYYYHSSIATCL